MIATSERNADGMLIDIKDMSRAGILEELVRRDQKSITNGTCRLCLDFLRRPNEFGSESSLSKETGINGSCRTRLEVGKGTYSNPICNNNEIFLYMPTVCQKDVTIEIDVGYFGY